MTAIRLLLVRHGNTFAAGETPVQVGCRSDLPLTDQGIVQAEALVRHYQAQGIQPVAVYSGRLLRQQQTAQVLAKGLSSHPVSEAQTALDEIDYGAWEGLTSAQIEARWPEACHAWNHAACWPDSIFAGSEDEHQQAIDAWLHNLRAQHQPGDTVIAVSSNGIIRWFLRDTPQWAQAVANRSIQDYKVKTGHYCDLRILPDRVQPVAWNVSPG